MDLVDRPYAILEAPSVLGLWPSGVELLPGALAAAGLHARLHARAAGVVQPPAWSPDRDAHTGIRNAAGIAHYAGALAAALDRVLAGGAFPVVLGGDCSLLLGALLALRRRGRHGLLFLDGHADFYQPEAEPAGEVASMELALATGHGPALLADLEGLGPLVREEDVALVGRRDQADAEAHGSERIEESAALLVDLAAIRRHGLRPAIEAALARVAAPALDGFWIHVDADVLDDAAMPAVDYRMPGGLAPAELAEVLIAARTTGRAVGLDLTIFNPSLDPDGALARVLVDVLGRGLGRE